MQTVILVAGAVVIAWLIFTFLFKIIKTTVKTALLVAAIVLLLMFFGIGPGEVFGLIGDWIGGGGAPPPAQPIAPGN
ncbi:MAG: hypothetical protein HC857_06885 [Synechococcales cyanobacterium RU_4_20]|nr:hypothetical protein [Synechococcales cyanobacterium RU_4_20]NJR70830.1 hypothetical protein [Synechococcales cyanobacterium CRU_2_2]